MKGFSEGFLSISDLDGSGAAALVVLYLQVYLNYMLAVDLEQKLEEHTDDVIVERGVTRSSLLRSKSTASV